MGDCASAPGTIFLPARALCALRQSANSLRLDGLSVWAACKVNQALVVNGLSA